jgi:hypothetical protein
MTSSLSDVCDSTLARVAASEVSKAALVRNAIPASSTQPQQNCDEVTQSGIGAGSREKAPCRCLDRQQLTSQMLHRDVAASTSNLGSGVRVPSGAPAIST